MVLIKFLVLLLSCCFASELPTFLTKHSISSLRFISSDGRYAYIEKKPGVLGLVSSFKSTDFISDSSASDFMVKASAAHQKMIIEIIPFVHLESNLMKKNQILVIDWGGSSTKEIGTGVDAKLHLQDEWISFYNPGEKIIQIKNIITQKAYEIKLSSKIINPFFRPEIEMINSENVVYTDLNDKGNAALIQFNLTTKKATIIYRSSQNATHLELCQSKDYLGVGEFAYEGINRGSSISWVKLNASANLAGLVNVYKSVENDIGNMVCMDKYIYFVKTLKQDKQTSSKVTEAVKLELATGKLEIKTDLAAVAQIINMDGRILVPMRGVFYVLEGQANISSDVLKLLPGDRSEELPFDL